MVALVFALAVVPLLAAPLPLSTSEPVAEYSEEELDALSSNVTEPWARGVVISCPR